MSSNLRVVFFGNSQSFFSNRFFTPLLDAPCDLVGVVDVPPTKRQSTNPMTATRQFSFVDTAHARGTPVFEPLNPNTPEFIGALAANSPDLFIAAGYMFLLKPSLLSIARMVAVNFHASLLPAYRGKHPVFWALRNGEREAGLTAHVMDPRFDTGDILYQVRVRTRKRDTVSTLYDRIIEKSCIARSPPDRRRVTRDAGAHSTAGGRCLVFLLDKRRTLPPRLDSISGEFAPLDTDLSGRMLGDDGWPAHLFYGREGHPV